MGHEGSGGPTFPQRHSPGETIGEYSLIESRGSGGMGEVWAVAAPNGAYHALKLMHEHWAEDLNLVARFRREFDVGSRIHHSNLVGMVFYDGGHWPPYLVMQLAPGKSLKRLLEKGGPFREWEVAAIGAQLGGALAELRRNGVTHRDLKASNIMVDRDLHATIIDFGIARLEGEATVANGEAFIGSAEYSSPEPYLGREVDPASDVYSLGIVLYEALVGKVPFRSDRYTDTLRMHAELPVPRISDRLPSVSPTLDNLLFAMLQKNPQQRPTAEQVAMACRSVLQMQGRPSPAPPSQQQQPFRRSEPYQHAPRYQSPSADAPLPVGMFITLGVAAVVVVAIVIAIAGGS